MGRSVERASERTGTSYLRGRKRRKGEWSINYARGTTNANPRIPKPVVRPPRSPRSSGRLLCRCRRRRHHRTNLHEMTPHGRGVVVVTPEDVVERQYGRNYHTHVVVNENVRFQESKFWSTQVLILLLSQELANTTNMAEFSYNTRCSDGFAAWNWAGFGGNMREGQSEVGT